MSSAETTSSTGFVYVATGERYVAEAAASAASLRRHHPQARICLVTDRPPGEKFWDDLVTLSDPRFGFRDKLEMRRAPYARCVFLDTDTAIFGDLTPLFTLLTRYDICGVQHSEGQDYLMEGGIPHAFPEMNGGMIGFRQGPATDEFFALWARFYEEFRELNRAGHYHYANIGDQKSLRAALWHSQVRHVCVGGEFNFIPFRLDLVSLPVSVVHTRTKADLAPLVARLNATLGRRTYVPSLDVVMMDSMHGPELRRLSLATARLLLRALGRTLAPRRLRDWLRGRRRLTGWLFGNRFESPSAPEGDSKWKNPTPRP
jgi:hypothetical protein